MKTKQISKRVLSVLLAVLMLFSTMLVSMISAGAVNKITGGYIYFDNSKTSWTDASIQFVIGHSGFSRTYVMSKLTNTNLYYCKLEDSTYHSWTDATYYGFIGSSGKFGDGNWGSSNLSNATHYTAAYTSAYGLDSGSHYLFTPSGSANGSSFSIAYKGSGDAFNSQTQTLKTKVSTDGGSTYSVVSSDYATMSIKSQYLDGSYQVQGSTSNASNGTATFGNCPAAKTTLSYSNVKTGYEFAGWYNSSGTRVGTGTTCEYYATGNTTYYAYFKNSGYSVKVQAGTGGTITTPSGGGTLTVGSTATSIKATPNTGYSFKNWTSANSKVTFANANSASTTITATGTDTVTANFTQNTYTITKDTTSNGSFTVSSTSAHYNDTITVNATPNAGYKLSSVKFNTSSANVSGNTATFKMPAANVTVTVTFAKENYSITTSASPSGSGSVSYTGNSGGTGNYQMGDTLKVTATPNAGYKLTNIVVKNSSGTTIGTYTSSPANVSLTNQTGAITITANFAAKPTYAVTTVASPADSGTVSVNDSTGYEGQVITVTATPKTGYSLKSITAVDADGKAVTVSNNKFTMPAKAVTVTATFEEYQPHAITVSQSTGGTVTSSVTSAKYGTQVTLSNIPADGYQFSKYTVTKASGGTVTVTSSKFTMPDEPVTVTGEFTLTPTRNFYVTGRFAVKESPDAIDWTWTENGWNLDSELIPFTRVGAKQLYKVETNFTLKELTDADYDHNKCYFQFMEKVGTTKTHYTTATSGNKALTDASGSSNVGSKFALGTTYSSNSNFYFDNASSTSKKYVVLYIDASSSTLKFYYQLESIEPKFTVTMEQGKSIDSGRHVDSSFLDGITGTTSVSHVYSDPTVLFTTKMKSYNGSSAYGFSGYFFKVYGYHINMTMRDGTTKLTSTTKVSTLKNGEYQASFTFPQNVESAVVTPVFCASDEYCKAKSMALTDVYVKMTPGSNNLGNAVETNYYVWNDDSKKIKEPTGVWGGQLLLYIGNDTYLAKTENGVSGMTFNNAADTTKQTFDYDEFVKLNKLGYDRVTFELKKNKNGDSIATTLNTNQASKGNKVFTGTTTKYSFSLTDTKRNNEFQLDTNIEGYYVDVFGDPLLDSSGNKIPKITNASTVTAELNTLLTKLSGKTTADCLYSARYGWYSDYDGFTTNRDPWYKMKYDIHSYYFKQDGTAVAQMVSGYGTIEGAQSPKDSSKTNAAWYYSQNPSAPLQYKLTANSSASNFTTGNEVISTAYKGVPFLVSYMDATSSRATANDDNQQGYTRVDGKWYYSATTPMLSVEAKPGMIGSDGKPVMSGGKIVENTTGGTALVNGSNKDLVEQGDTCTISGIPNEGYVIDGYYTESGEQLPDNQPIVGSSATYFVVYKALEGGSVTLTNNLYTGTNPKNGGGSGALGVELLIKRYDSATGTYGEAESFTGSTSVSASIGDLDKLQWVVKARPTGADEFKCFRQRERLADGSIFYASFNDADCLSVDSATGTYTYKSNEIIWNWAQQDTSGSNKVLISTFTDFRKVSVFATLHYEYLDRYNQWKTYTVTDVQLSNAEIENDYTPSDQTIAAHAPYIDEVVSEITWNLQDNKKLEIDKAEATLVATQTPKKFHTYIDYGEDGNLLHSEQYYNSIVTLDALPSIEVNGEVKNFSYWEQISCDDEGNLTESTWKKFSYERYEQVRVTFNRYFRAVYGMESTDPFFTDLQEATYTREKYTDDKGNVFDYVYSGFLLQFQSAVKDIQMRDFVDGTNGADKYATGVKFGLFLERDYNYTYDGGETITAPAVNADYLNSTVLRYAAGLDRGETVNGWSDCTDKTAPQYNYYYNFYDLTNNWEDLTDKGRMYYYFKFANTEENRGKVYNAYTYIIYTDAVTGEQKIIISQPEVLSIYATGIKPDGSGSTVI